MLTDNFDFTTCAKWSFLDFLMLTRYSGKNDNLENSECIPDSTEFLAIQVRNCALSISIVFKLLQHWTKSTNICHKKHYVNCELDKLTTKPNRSLSSTSRSLPQPRKNCSTSLSSAHIGKPPIKTRLPISATQRLYL
jgi:hypothetical protein